MADEIFLEVCCSGCGHSKLYGQEEMLSYLRRLGKFRRSAKPKLDIVQQLFESTAETMPCGECGHIGMQVSVAEIDDDWGDAKCCERCAVPIPIERLEIFPETKLCMKCQSASDSGSDEQMVEYCPRCGSVMSMQPTTKSGLTGYTLKCGACGYR